MVIDPRIMTTPHICGSKTQTRQKAPVLTWWSRIKNNNYKEFPNYSQKLPPEPALAASGESQMPSPSDDKAPSNRVFLLAERITWTPFTCTSGSKLAAGCGKRWHRVLRTGWTRTRPRPPSWFHCYWWELWLCVRVFVCVYDSFILFWGGLCVGARVWWDIV